MHSFLKLSIVFCYLLFTQLSADNSSENKKHISPSVKLYSTNLECGLYKERSSILEVQTSLSPVNACHVPGFQNTLSDI